MTEQEHTLRKEFLRFSIVITVLVLILGGFLLYLSIPLLGDKTIILDTRPLDPFDPLLGQYVTIAYEIGTINSNLNVEAGDTVYVILYEDENGISRYQSASLTKPKEESFIKGEVKSVYNNKIRIEYGIEKYFFERGATFPTRGIQIEVKLSDSGQGRISELLQDGKQVKIQYENKSITS